MMIVVLTVGILLNRISWVDVINPASVEGYAILLSLFLFGQFVLLHFIDRNTKEIRSVNSVIRLNRIGIWVSQILLSSLTIALFIEILVISKYHTVLLTAICWIAYSVSIIFTGILTYMFLSWYRRQRNIITIVYGVASSIIVLNLIVTLVFSTTILSSRPNEVRQFLVSSGVYIGQGSVLASLDSLHHFSSIAMFLAMWFATAVLLHYYASRVGKVRFWILITLPLAYFLSQFLSDIINISIIFAANPFLIGIILTSVYTISLVVGGILFGIAFIRLSSKFNKTRSIRNYLVIAGYGFTFLLISNNGILLSTLPYPPYAVLGVTFIGVASYSILLGIYSSAIVASNDTELRKSIKKFALQEGKLLDSIGIAEVQKMLQERASQMWSENQKFVSHEIGFDTLSKEEVEMQVKEIMEELIEIKSRKNGHS
jgi:hypothetical protein